MEVLKSVVINDDPCGMGCSITYTITGNNVGMNNFVNVVINDLLPTEVTYVSDTPSQGSYDDITGVWSAGPINSGSSATLTINATVNTITDISNCASLDVASSNPLDTFPDNNSDCADITPTRAVLSDFRAYEDNGQVVIEWATASEIDTAGFHIFRLDESADDYIKINDQILPGLLTSPQGGTYSLVDTGASPYNSLTYVLMEIEGKGKENVYGPYTVQVGGDSAVMTANGPNTINRKQLLTCTGDTCRGGQEVQSSSKSAKEISVYVDKDGVTVVTNKQNGAQEQKYTVMKTGRDPFSGYIRKAHESADRSSRIEGWNKERDETANERESRSGDNAKISVIDNGVYYLDSSKISSLLGISSEDAIKNITTNRIALSNQGKKVAYLPAEGNGGIFFYVKGIDSIYTNENVYWLKEGRGLQMERIDDDEPGWHAGGEPMSGLNASGSRDNGGRSKGPDTPGSRDDDRAINEPDPVESGSFTETLHFEENKFVVPALTHDPESDYWFWDYIVGGNASFDIKAYTIRADGVAYTQTEATLTAYLQGFTDTTSNPDHHVVITLNGTLLGEAMWDGSAITVVDLPFDQALLSEGMNTVEVKGMLDTGAPYSMFYVDSFDLTYQKLYKAVEDMLVCSGGNNQTITINGFTDSDILVFDITDSYKPRLIEATTIDEVDGTFKVSFTSSSPDKTYFVLSSGAAITELPAWADTPSNLLKKNNYAAYLVIAPEELKDASQSLADYRQSQGLETMVVILEDIMDEFNYGISSPEAIRDFLAHAYQNWNTPPKYVVLAGEGTYDYKDNQGKGDNLIPTMMTDTPFGLFPSDNLFADADGNHVPEMAIGRLSVLTSDELLDVLNKIMSYEASARERVLLVADNPDGGGVFPADSDEIGALVPPPFVIEKIYLSDYDIGSARQLLLNEMNSGAFLLNYIGHGGVDRLATEGMLRTSDLGSLANWDRLPIITAMTCSVGNYAIQGYDSLSEALVLKDNGGAVAVWAPTGLSYNSLSKILDEAFFNDAFGNNEALLGDAILNAYQAYNAHGGSVFVMDIYNLQGDPALKMW